MKYLTSLSLTSATLPVIVSTTISTVLGLLIPQSAQAFTLDFQKAPDIDSNGNVTADVFDS